MDAAGVQLYRERVSWRMILSENRLPLFRIMRPARVAELVDATTSKIVFRKEWGFDSPPRAPLHCSPSFAVVRHHPIKTKNIIYLPD